MASTTEPRVDDLYAKVGETLEFDVTFDIDGSTDLTGFTPKGSLAEDYGKPIKLDLEPTIPIPANGVVHIEKELPASLIQNRNKTFIAEVWVVDGSGRAYPHQDVIKVTLSPKIVLSFT